MIATDYLSATAISVCHGLEDVSFMFPSVKATFYDGKLADGRQNIQISIWTSSSSTRMKLLVENHIQRIAVVHAGARLFTSRQKVTKFCCLQFYFARILQEMLGKCQRFYM